MSQSPFKVFIVEDNEWYNKLLVHNVSMNPDIEVKSFFSGKDVLNALDENPSVITLDYRLPDMLGNELITEIKNFNPSIEVIIISEQTEIEVAVELLQLGAYDYIVKSKDIGNRILNHINRISQNSSIKKELKTLKKEVQGKYDFQKSIIVESKALKRVFTLIDKSLDNNITVSITGETGTGKEVVAKAIHYNSNRKDHPFVAVNMAAIPKDLIESELFGYEKGAFTGASARRIGKFEEANGGTIFLDEIGEMDISFQAKLLRVLQERELTRVGGNNKVKLNSRIIVATHKNLLQEVKNGNFREDLYYRLYGLPIELPPLREREKDVLLLAIFFIKNFCKENQYDLKKLSEGAKNKILGYQWPGNVRELKSVIELAIVLSSGDEILSEDLQINAESILPSILAEKATMREYNIEIVKFFMKKFNDNTKQVADHLDIGQTTVYRLLKEDKEE